MKRLSIIPYLVIVVLVTACDSIQPTVDQSSVNLDATVETHVQATLNALSGTSISEGDHLKPTITPTEISDEVKIKSWKGEKVIILPATSIQSDLQIFYGKTGFISDVDTEGFDLTVTLDDSGEEVQIDIRYDGSHIGFFSEMEVARSLVGKTLWSKMYKELRRDCTNRASDKIIVRNIESLTISKVEWGEIIDPIILYFNTNSGEEGCWDPLYEYIFDSRFHIKTFPMWSNYSNYFYFENPHEMQPDWSKTIWELIENNTVAIGMTEEMVAMACDGALEIVGAVLSQSNDTASTIYKCGNTSFIIKDGVVTDYYQP